MAKLQEIFNRIKESKKKQKTIRKTYKDVLDNNQEHKELLEKLKKLKERKKQIEEIIKNEFSAEFNKLDALKLDIETDNQLLSDIAFNQLVKGQAVEVMDEGDNKYEPIFKVKFKKV